jgi:hypothetical protein
MTMPTRKTTALSRRCYQAFLLRFWAEADADPKHQTIWRFSLEDPHTRVQLGFASLAELIFFLEERIMNSDANFNPQNEK